MPLRKIKLSEYDDDFVRHLVACGRFTNVSEAIQAGLQMLEQQVREDEEKLNVLRQLAIDDFDELDGGEDMVLHGEEPLRECIADKGRRAPERLEERTPPKD